MAVQRAGVIGLGPIGNKHAQIYAAMQDVVLAAVCDRDQSRADAAGQRFGRTGGHTNGCEAFIQTVDAQIALLHLAVAAVLGHPERAGRKTGFTADAFIRIHTHDAVGGPFADGAGRTHGHTGRFTAVHATKRNGSRYNFRERPLP